MKLLLGGVAILLIITFFIVVISLAGSQETLVRQFVNSSQTVVARYFPQRVQQPTPTPAATTQTATTQMAVLGTSNEFVSPETLYGLINGYRRTTNQPILQVNPLLERTAVRLITDEDNQMISDPKELAVSFGYRGGEIAVISTENQPTNWKLFEEISTDDRNALLLRSSSSSEMGVAVECSAFENKDSCQAILVLAN